MKRAKSIFLWCGELVEQWRGWLPYWGFCSKKVRILTKRYRQFSKFGFWAIVASPRLWRGSASAVILKGNLKSKNNFCPLKRKFAVRSTDKMKFYKPIFFSFAFGERQSDNLILTAQ